MIRDMACIKKEEVQKVLNLFLQEGILQTQQVDKKLYFRMNSVEVQNFIIKKVEQCLMNLMLRQKALMQMNVLTNTEEEVKMARNLKLESAITEVSLQLMTL